MAKESEKKTEKLYYANIEGVEYPWHKETITVREIRSVGNLPPELAIVQELPGGKEKTLADTDVVHLKPGYRYGRAPKFKRGF